MTDAERKSNARYYARHCSFERAAAEGLTSIVATTASKSEDWYDEKIKQMRNSETGKVGEKRRRYLDKVLENPGANSKRIRELTGFSRTTQWRYKKHLKNNLKKK